MRRDVVRNKTFLKGYYMFTFERYRFNGSFNQRLPNAKCSTFEEAKRVKAFDISCGIECYEIEEEKVLQQPTRQG
jgi:hypothetical protein